MLAVTTTSITFRIDSWRFILVTTAARLFYTATTIIFRCSILISKEF